MLESVLAFDRKIRETRPQTMSKKKYRSSIFITNRPHSRRRTVKHRVIRGKEGFGVPQWCSVETGMLQLIYRDMTMKAHLIATCQWTQRGVGKRWKENDATKNIKNDGKQCNYRGSKTESDWK